MSFEAKLRMLGYVIEPAPLDNGHVLQAVMCGNMLYTSGQVSRWEGTEVRGQVGTDITLEQAQEAAKFCGLNCLRAIKTVTGTLECIARIAKVVGLVNVAPGFNDTSTVVNGCSDFLREVFGDFGQHARTAVGVTVPAGWAVEVEMVAEIRQSTTK